MGFLGALVLVFGAIGALGFLPHDTGPLQENFLNDALLRDVVQRMGAELSDVSDSYAEFGGRDPRLSLMARGGAGSGGRGGNNNPDCNNAESEQVDYDSLMDGNPNPSLRDQEYLQHSSLWGHQYVAGGAGEGDQRLTPNGMYKNQHQVKTDATLPAYCNPPNPCPVGYTEDQGCTSVFDNTAAFSREYQSSQACMCDGEHMFDCTTESDRDLEKGQPFAGSRATQGPAAALISRQFHADERKGLVAKKYNNNKSLNPYLYGEKLPVAAKKGINVDYRM